MGLGGFVVAWPGWRVGWVWALYCQLCVFEQGFSMFLTLWGPSFCNCKVIPTLWEHWEDRRTKHVGVEYGWHRAEPSPMTISYLVLSLGCNSGPCK